MANELSNAEETLAHLSSGQERPIAELLVYVGLELRSLCSAANSVEASVADLITDNPTTNPRTVEGLQNLDRLIQHMDGLADYLAALAEASRGAGAVDPSGARQVLKIARLRQGLAGGALGAARAEPAAADDDDGFELL
jgi:hypothetical protein